MLFSNLGNNGGDFWQEAIKIYFVRPRNISPLNGLTFHEHNLLIHWAVAHEVYPIVSPLPNVSHLKKFVVVFYHNNISPNAVELHCTFLTIHSHRSGYPPNNPII